jgi:(S)-2-hydroxyglutarate dehydrogenase
MAVARDCYTDGVAAQIDVLVVGGGILGLATSHCLLAQRPGTSIVVLEKEPAIARHQTGRNSGVLHSGIYYKPGSLKAANCRVGKSAMERLCAEEGVPYEICGKVIVALGEGERPRLEALLARGIANGVRCKRISRERLRELEPHAAGVEALHVPETGIVDYRRVCERLAARIAERGGTVMTEARAVAFSKTGNRTLVSTAAAEYDARIVVNCAGLQSDRVTRLAGGRPPARIVPFRGEYFELVPEKRHLCRNLIYPVPDPAFPFLGVHFTRRIGGGVECGPNAVLALAREGYTKGSANLRDLWETLTYGGFLRLARKHWRTGAGEMWRSLSKRAFTRALQRLLPEVEERDLKPAPAGVRAQAVAPDGSMVDDFLIVEDDRAVHVNNAPSPAATASLEIGRLVAEKVMARLR